MEAYVRKTSAKGNNGTVADQVAEFIGRSMGELLNQKDALTKQMADVDQQIADVRARVIKQFGAYLPATSRKARAKRAAGRAVREAKVAIREISEETRAKMKAAAKRRWARERGKTGKTAKRR